MKKLLEQRYSGYLVIEPAPPLSQQSLASDLTRAHQMFKPYERPAGAAPPSRK